MTKVSQITLQTSNYYSDLGRCSSINAVVDGASISVRFTLS